MKTQSAHPQRLLSSSTETKDKACHAAKRFQSVATDDILIEISRHLQTIQTLDAQNTLIRLGKIHDICARLATHESVVPMFRNARLIRDIYADRKNDVLLELVKVQGADLKNVRDAASKQLIEKINTHCMDRFVYKIQREPGIPTPVRAAAKQRHKALIELELENILTSILNPEC